MAQVRAGDIRAGQIRAGEIGAGEVGQMEIGMDGGVHTFPIRVGVRGWRPPGRRP